MLNRRAFATCAICTAVGLAATTGDSNAQGAPGFKRTVLRKIDYPGDKYVCVMIEIEVEPNAVIARHTHPGIESTTMVSGSMTLSVKGEPDRVLNAGDSFQIPPEVPHAARNGAQVSKAVANYVVEKDKPLATPAPE